MEKLEKNRYRGELQRMRDEIKSIQKMYDEAEDEFGDLERKRKFSSRLEQERINAFKEKKRILEDLVCVETPKVKVQDKTKIAAELSKIVCKKSVNHKTQYTRGLTPSKEDI